MEEFLKILSPSMRLKVTNQIFELAILKNAIFCDKMDVVEYIIDFIQPKFFFPEDRIITMGQRGKLIYFIANGDCEVSVTNHLKQNLVVKQLHPGDYFGEIAVMLESARSSNIDSINYCTMAHLSSEYFKRLCNVSPEMYTCIKERALQVYDDDWIKFKMVLLKQVDYFRLGPMKPNSDRFYAEIQYYMEESVFQPGTEIIQVGDACGLLMFIVNGLVEVEVIDGDHNKYLLDTL